MAAMAAAKKSVACEVWSYCEEARVQFCAVSLLNLS